MFRFTYFFILITLTAFTIGCETDNPLCTDNFCVTGEVFAKEDLADDQAYDELEIDDGVVLDVIAENVGNIEVTVIRPEDTDLGQRAIPISDVVSDVEDGGVTYLGETVVVQATVSFKLLPGTFMLETANDGVNFYLSSPERTDVVDAEEGKEYYFEVRIREIESERGLEWSEELGQFIPSPDYNIWATLLSDPVATR